MSRRARGAKGCLAVGVRGSNREVPAFDWIILNWSAGHWTTNYMLVNWISSGSNYLSSDNDRAHKGEREVTPLCLENPNTFLIIVICRYCILRDFHKYTMVDDTIVQLTFSMRCSKLVYGQRKTICLGEEIAMPKFMRVNHLFSDITYCLAADQSGGLV